jgi:hypothetical protein
MNKDESKELTLHARIRLEISAEHVEREMLSCKQEYFKSEDVRGAKPLMTLIKCLECISCKRTPLNLNECLACKSIICRECHNKILYQGNGQCPEP